MTPEEKKQLADLMLNLVPEAGKTIGNKSLRASFLKKTKVSEDDYWDIRNQLVEEGILTKGRGRGGAVFRTPPLDTASESSEASIPAQIPAQVAETEKELYKPFYRTISSYWVKENDIKEFVIEETAQQGRRSTGGRWTRPDVTLISVGNYPFIPGKYLK
jgi:hypothetical protein